MKRALYFVSGLLIGTALFGGGTAFAASYLTAEPSTQTFYVDGQQVHLEAYAIDGNNYVKLRDIGQAVGFNVYWQDGVQIDSDAPYTGEAPAQADTSIRVSSYKGNTLKTGEGTGLIVYPYSTNDTAVSSNPAIVRVERVLGRWTATAQAPGTATITVTAPDGRTGSVTITVGSAAPAAPAQESSASLTDNMEKRQELIRLINQTRKANGAAELPVNEALMNAAQAISDKRYTWHHTQEECEAVIACGYPYGFGANLTAFTGIATEDAAQHALDNWIKSPGHFQTMIDPDCDGIGVGITESGGTTYCYMFVGRPNTHNPYE